MQKGEIQIYKTNSGTEIQVNLDKETVWLDAHLIAKLFDVNRPAIVKHIRNIYSSGELIEQTTCSKMEQVAADGKKRKMHLYNLDTIISVGYRVNSSKATQFRIWATQRLKEHLVQGYTLNQKRLNELSQNMQQLEVAVNLIKQTAQNDALKLNEAKGLLNIIAHYTQSFVLLNQYDSNSIETHKLNEDVTYEIQYKEAKQAITELKKQLIAKKEATELFGNEKDDSFKSSLRSIVQTFGRQYLYPSIEEQAAHLLYFVIKNHSFSDGNKRIGAFLFIWFLEKNKHRFKQNGEAKINDNGLTALALLVAQSHPDEKELMVKLIVNLIATK
ncbi:RhuM family protein [Yeosuana sp. AK3]